MSDETKEDIAVVDKKLEAMQDAMDKLLERMDRIEAMQTYTVPQPTDWEIYTCAKCQTTKCEYMYDDHNINGQCKREDEGGGGFESNEEGG